MTPDAYITRGSRKQTVEGWRKPLVLGFVFGSLVVSLPVQAALRLSGRKGFFTTVELPRTDIERILNLKPRTTLAFSLDRKGFARR